MSRCRKLGYKDELGAKIALASTYKAKSSKREEKRYYRCTIPGCRKWHLTSEEKKEPVNA